MTKSKTKKVSAPKKPTVEQTLRAQIDELKLTNQYASEKYQELSKAHNALKESIFGIAKLFAVDTEDVSSVRFYVKRSRDFGYDNSSDDENLSNTQKAVSSITRNIVGLMKDFAREDEGTALMQEHIESLKDVIAQVTHDESRANPRREREMIIAHNLRIAEKNGQFISPDNANLVNGNSGGKCAPNF